MESLLRKLADSNKKRKDIEKRDSQGCYLKSKYFKVLLFEFTLLFFLPFFLIIRNKGRSKCRKKN